MSEEFIATEKCPVCGKNDRLELRPCRLGPDYESDVFCSRCQCKIPSSKWNTRALTPKQQCSDEMYEMLNDFLHNHEFGDMVDAKIKALLKKVRGE